MNRLARPMLPLEGFGNPNLRRRFQQNIATVYGIRLSKYGLARRWHDVMCGKDDYRQLRPNPPPRSTNPCLDEMQSIEYIIFRFSCDN